MKLNPKCIRDLLEVFEETVQDANTTYHFESMEDLQEDSRLTEYTSEELAYHCQQLSVWLFLSRKASSRWWLLFYRHHAGGSRTSRQYENT